MTKLQASPGSSDSKRVEPVGDDKMFSFEIELRGEKARVEGWFSGTGPDDPCAFDIDAIWIGWTPENRGMPESAGGPNPLDLSTLTDDEDEAITDAAFSAVAALFPADGSAAEVKREGEIEKTRGALAHAIQLMVRMQDALVCRAESEAGQRAYGEHITILRKHFGEVTDQLIAVRDSASRVAELERAAAQNAELANALCALADEVGAIVAFDADESLQAKVVRARKAIAALSKGAQT